jgi:hypothetical protein
MADHSTDQGGIELADLKAIKQHNRRRIVRIRVQSSAGSSTRLPPDGLILNGGSAA